MEIVLFLVNEDDGKALGPVLNLKQQHGARLTVVGLGPKYDKVSLKLALALGADRAVLLSAVGWQGHSSILNHIFDAVSKKLGNCGMLLTGKSFIEKSDFQYPSMLDFLKISDDMVEIWTDKDLLFNEESTKIPKMIFTDVSDETIHKFAILLKQLLPDGVKENNENVVFVPEIAVGCGRGMLNNDGIKLCKKMAKELGASLVCTTPVVVSNSLPRENLVGQSGKKIMSGLYIAVGISGSVQHLCSVTSDYIVAINSDPKARIWEFADLGIVGDANIVLPRLIQTMRKAGLSNGC